MKRLLLFLLFMVNLQIVIQKDGIAMTLFSDTYAQHMDLEGGNYDCFDEVTGWFKSPIPCDGVIITPDEDYVECPWCYQEFSTSEFADHENICPQRPGAGEDDPFHSDSENNGDIGGGGYGGFGGGTSTGGSSGNSGSGTGGNWPSNTLYIPKPGETLIPNYTIPTKWREQLPNKYSCFLCCMEYIYNIQHSSPDFWNNNYINGTNKYYMSRGNYEGLYKSYFKQDYFHGVVPGTEEIILSLAEFQYVEISHNEIRDYINNQYFIILSYKTVGTSGHAVVVFGYDNNNNFSIIDPEKGKSDIKKDEGIDVSIYAISPYTYNSKIRKDFDYE